MVRWSVLFELLLLGGIGCRDPTSVVQLVVMKWTEHSFSFFVSPLCSLQ